MTLASLNPEFVSARSKLEAVSRISALTHSAPETLGPGSKERKSALQNLATGLDLNVDLTQSKPILAEAIANTLGVPWGPECWSAGQTITLIGLNRLLDGGSHRLESLKKPSTSKFVTARGKLEAVSRISALTHSPPETLGPGSKERKSALQNLATGLDLNVDLTQSKPILAEAIANTLGVPWGPECWSAGQTITLIGLNRLLDGAEVRLRHRERSRGGPFLGPEDEAIALVRVLADSLPHHLDGRACVTEMFEAEHSQWAQDEWAAFYFEYVGLPALINTFGGGPRTFANTRFDYALKHTWDLKVHMAFSGTAPLNDCDAIHGALDAGTGAGFLVLTGDVEYDDGEFRQWQREFKVARGKLPRVRTGPPKYVRKSKPAFTPAAIEAFYLPDRPTLDFALANGSIKVMSQGAQTSGQPRRPKYSMDLVKARWGQLLAAQHVL